MTMPANTDLQAQIDDLQATIAHLEMTIDNLDAVIAKQDKQMQDMARQLKLIYGHIQKQTNEDGIAPFDVFADVPPHY